MLTEERLQIITDTVNSRSSVTIAELSRILDVSPSTVKRDLNILAEAGKITKVRGGAIALGESFSAVEKNVEEKSAMFTASSPTDLSTRRSWRSAASGCTSPAAR